MHDRTPHSNGNGVSTPPGADHDRFIARLLSDSRKAEALQWLKAARNGHRTIGGCKTTANSTKFVENLYALGAVEIIAAQIQPRQNGGGEHTGKIVVKLPKEADRRKALFNWCAEQGDSLGFSPDLDQGESHLFLLLD